VRRDRHHASVTAFTLPITVAVVDVSTTHRIPIALRVPGPVPWRLVADAVGAAAGLPPGTTLHLGPGAVEADWIVGVPPLLAGVLLRTRPADRITVAAPLALAVIAGPDAGGSVALGRRTVTIGRARGNDVIVDDPAVSATHAAVAASTTGLLIRDLGSTNGIRIDGRPIHPVTGTEVAPGSLIRIGGSLLRAGLTTESPAGTRPDARGRLLVHRVPAARVPDPPDLGPPPAPPDHRRRSIPLLAGVISGLLGGALAVVLGSWLYLAVAAVGPLTMVASAFGERASGRRRRRRDWRDHARKTAAWSVAVAQGHAARRDAAWARHPDPATLMRRAREVRAGIWSRRRDDPERLCLAIGVDTGEGRTDAVLAGDARTGAAGPGAIGESPGASRAVRVSRPTGMRSRPTGPPWGGGSDRRRRSDRVARPLTPAEMPVVVDLARIGVLGLVGAAVPLLRWLVLQATCLMSPLDLRVVVFSDRPDLLSCDDLPHCLRTASAPGPDGFDRTPGTAGSAPHPDLLVVVDGMSRWRSDPRVAALLTVAGRGQSRGGRAMAVLCRAEHREDLPAGCVSVVEVRPGAHQFTGPGPDRHPTGLDQPAPGLDRCPPGDDRCPPAVGAPGRLAITGISAERFQETMSALAALADSDDRLGVPDTVQFGDLHGPIDPAAMRRRWSAPATAATIGVTGRGPVAWDLDRDGPHLLVAGTTGSGKSELLLTLIAGLAAAAPPDRTSFLLVDYKGGAAFAALGGLPHVTGVVTDLDGPLAERALVSLRAELRRRELGARAGAAPPPRLVIVVDEFAVLTREVPAFLIGLVDIAQRGRSLGLHLVLATQRPSGVVSPAIRANIATRICLRVTDPADSVDMVGVPTASEIPATTPGRALIWTAGQPPALFQAARVTAPADPGIVAWRRDRPGSPSRTAPADPTAPPTGACPPARVIPAAGVRDTRSELDRLVAAMSEAARGRERPPPPWVPPLPDRISADQVDRGCVAMVDRPDRQCWVPLTIPDGSVLVIGDPGSGRSTAVARFAWTAAATGARLIVIDPRGGLAAWCWAAADTVLDGADPTLVGRVLELIGTGSPGERHESILLAIDGWEDVVATLDAADHGATTSRLLRLFDAAPAGVRVVASGRRPLHHHPVAHRAAHLIELGTEDSEPVPGRGRYRGDALQVVLPPPEPWPGPADGVSRHRDRDGPSGHARIVVRALPTVVLQRDLPISGPDSVPVGCGGDAAIPIEVDLAGGGGAWVIAGPRRSGVSTTLLTLATGAAAAGIPVLWAGTGPTAPRAAPGRPPVWRVVASAPELQDALAEHTGPLALFADTGVLHGDRRPGSGPPDRSGSSDTSMFADLLSRFCRVCGPGQHLILGTRPEVVAGAFHGPVAEALTFRQAILLDADAADGPRLGVRLPRRTSPPPPGRGVLIRGGAATPVQIARPDPT
jgi:S-DNA-T family DNA segregation ATPase FtsK/SpoIIIE